jgi:hypothetical protein
MQSTKNSIAKAVGVAVIGAAFAALGAGAAQAAPVVGGAANSESGSQGQQATAAVPAQVSGPKIMVAGVPLTPAAAFAMLGR